MFRAIAESKSGSFLLICVAFILGAGVASIFIKNSELFFPLFCFAVALAVFTVWFWKDLQKRLLILMILFFALGVLRFMNFLPAGGPGELKFYNGQTVFLKGTVAKEPDASGMSARFVFEASEVAGTKVEGLAQIKVLKYPEYRYGEILEITCELKNPPDDLKKYLAGKNIYSVCEYPKSIARLGEGGNPALSAIFFAKKKFSENIFKIFPEPHASLLSGILYGEDGGLSYEIQKSFRVAGLSHIVAVSGSNIAIVAGFVFFILSFLFIPKKFVFWIAFLAICAFSLASGAEASVVRAGLMYFAVKLAVQIGRKSKQGNVLILAAAAMAAQNPKILVFDIGFQLSFAAIVGLFYLSPVLEKKMRRLWGDGSPDGAPSPDSLFNGVKKLFIETSSAIFMTAPIILYYFGDFSFAALPANLAILFFIPPAMLFGFLSGIFGMIFFPLGKIFGFLAWTVLNYIISTVEWMAKIPYASAEFGRAPLIFVLGLYLMIFYFAFWRKNFTEEIMINDKTENFVIYEDE